MDEDVDSEWDTLKNVPKTKVTPLDTQNLRQDILDVRHQHPEYIYRVNAGYGLSTMAMWRAKCFYKRVLQHGWQGSPNVKEVFAYSLDKLLIAGAGYDHSRPVDGKQYMGACKSFKLTLEEAIDEWELIKDGWIKTALETVDRYRKEAAERLKWATECEALVEVARKPLTIEALKQYRGNALICIGSGDEFDDGRDPTHP